MGAATELWLIRHGETEWSLSRKHTGRTDIGLTEHGRKRAREMGDYLAGKKFAAVLTSPLKRARETCEIAGFGDVAKVDPDLQEWDYGVREGRTTEEIRAETPGWSVWTHEITGGEALEHVGARADEVIERALAAAGDGDRVALFAHAHILRILAARWVGLAAREGRLFVLGTGSVSVLGWEREARAIQAWNRGFEE